MKEIRVVAFDCDGVLFDSLRANTAYYNQVLEHFGRPIMTRAQLAYVHMHTAVEAIAHLFDGDEEILQEVEVYRRRMGYMKFIKYMEIEPYLKSLLDWLRPRFKTAIVTNRADTMDRVLVEHDLEGYFDLVVCALDVDRPKPHPDSLNRVLEHFKIGADRAIYVGDSEVDEVAAKAAGIPLVAYKNRALSADFHIESLREIQAIVGAQAGRLLN